MCNAFDYYREQGNAVAICGNWLKEIIRQCQNQWSHENVAE